MFLNFFACFKQSNPRWRRERKPCKRRSSRKPGAANFTARPHSPTTFLRMVWTHSKLRNTGMTLTANLSLVILLLVKLQNRDSLVQFQATEAGEGAWVQSMAVFSKSGSCLAPWLCLSTEYGKKYILTPVFTHQQPVYQLHHAWRTSCSSSCIVRGLSLNSL